VFILNERQIKLQIIEKAELIAKSLARGKEIEIKKLANGVTVEEINRKVISK
jgi:hypothetical protein